jgi:hypothetical protein
MALRNPLLILLMMEWTSALGQKQPFEKQQNYLQ